MKTLSIFVDESGDFGEYDVHSPYYIISLIFHNQSISLSKQLNEIEQSLSNIGYPTHCVHTGPLIRGEEEYRDIDITERISILRKMMTFFRKTGICYKSFSIEKKQIEDASETIAKLNQQISDFVMAHFSEFAVYDKVIIYYDNGQIQVSRILKSSFGKLMNNVEFRKVIPSDYRLFQVADLTCSINLIKLKWMTHTMSKTEKMFFKNENILQKQYFRILNNKEYK